MVHKRKISNIVLTLALAGLFLGSVFGADHVFGQESGASLYLSPSSGPHAVGDTFSVSVYLNTSGRYVNAIEADLHFPPDKLQIVSPSVGKSVIDVWVGQPSFSNSNGTVSFRGAIPNPGLNVSQGLISTFTFRVKSTGKAVVGFTDKSKVLLNDGKGTDVLSSTSGAIFDLVLPPPQGPIVASPSHPDQSRWYPNNSVVLEWQGDVGAGAYSYVLDSEPVSTPDETPEPREDSVSYLDVSDGIHYFHIRAHREGAWSGVTHYAVRIDTSMPADFELGIEPRKVTTSRRPIISFESTDANSSLDHYELKIVPLSRPKPATLGEKGPQEFFIEVTSPYIPELSPGKYDIILRAYDQAGNFREVKDRITILTSALSLVALFTPSSPLGFIVLLIALILAAYLSRKYKHWHAHVSDKHIAGATNNQDVASKLAKLREYQKRYGHLVVLISLSVVSALSIFSPREILAYTNQVETGTLVPPIITTLSDDITNDEIFYVGGKYPIPGTLIAVYLQNEDTGEASNFFSVVDDSGDWFYSHSDFISVGHYVVWAQAGNDQNLKSPPSARENFKVTTRAISIGSSRVSLELVYGSTSLLLALATLLLLIRAFYHFQAGKKKHATLMKEVMEAEESVRRGFALIRRDIETELGTIKKMRASRKIEAEELEKEKTLLSDLRIIEETVGKEIWDIRANT